jgi:aryl-alcohol dehydrogenase-like predicted oxidoreductase
VRADRLGEGDFRSANPRFTGEAGAANQAIAAAVAEVASSAASRRTRSPWRGCTPRAPASAWPSRPTPGTKRVRWLEQNVAALDLRLTEQELAVLDGLADRVVGARY